MDDFEDKLAGLKVTPPKPLSFSMDDLATEISSINIYRQMDDKRWDSITKTLNSEFPLHNARPEAVCDGIRSDMDQAFESSSSDGHRFDKWDIIEILGMTAFAISVAYILSLSLSEVLKIIGG